MNLCSYRIGERIETGKLSICDAGEEFTERKKEIVIRNRFELSA